MLTAVNPQNSVSLSKKDALQVQNSKLLTKLLFLTDSGTRDIGTIITPNENLLGIIEFESYKSPNFKILRYRVDSEFNGADQWKVWTCESNKLVFRASEVAGDNNRSNPIFLWRSERPHGRLQPSNSFIGDWKTRCPPITEPFYELHIYQRGEWEDEITKIVRGMLNEGSRLFDVPYRSNRRLILTGRNLEIYNRYYKNN